MNAADRLRTLAAAGPEDGYFITEGRGDNVDMWVVWERLGKIGCDDIAVVDNREHARLIALAPELAAWAADAADMVFNQVMAGGVQCECGDCEVCDGVALLARLDRILGEQP